MPKLNENFFKLEKNYLFINIAKKIKAFTEEHPEADIIRMGIGDVTLPIAQCVIDAMKKGADEMAVKETFKGYEDSGAGYDFLREAVSGYYKSFG
ncbi:MAG: LL-diaminopimelate aminotransferase, partial [Ruminococcus sp.]|nr:LL-diaminopimelate aminotransferase [Ruminococcus sp.]